MKVDGPNAFLNKIYAKLRNSRKTTHAKSYVSDVRYISSSVKIYKGMFSKNAFYLRILFGRFISGSFYFKFYLEIFLEFTTKVSIVSSRYYFSVRRQWTDSVDGFCGRFGRILWVSLDGISWTRSCLANNFSLF